MQRWVPGDGSAMSRPQKLLVLRPGAVGDGLLSFPALAALRRARPDLYVILAAHPAIGLLAQRFQACDQFVSFDSPAVAALYTRDGGKLAMQHWGPTTHAVVWSKEPPAALRENLRALRVSRPVLASPEPGRAGVHVAAHLVATLRSLAPRLDNAEIDSIAPSGASPPSPRSGAGKGRSGPLKMALHPGSGSARKNWPTARFLDLGRRWQSQLRGTVTIVLGPAEAGIRAQVSRAAVEQGWSTADNLSLDQLAEVLSDHDIYVGNDSGVSHLAGIHGAPTVALFGPTDPDCWAPVGPLVRTVRAQPIEQLALTRVWDEVVDLISACGYPASAALSE